MLADRRKIELETGVNKYIRLLRSRHDLIISVNTLIGAILPDCFSGAYSIVK
jgi:hypothetical protein